MNRIFDTHAHYTDSRFDEYPGGADALLSELLSGSVGNIINVSVDTANSEAAVDQALRHPGTYAAVGVHPTEAHREESLASAMDKLRKMLDDVREKRIVAVGEIGLDYHYDDTDKPLQNAFFDAQLTLAEEYRLPVIIHDRDAHGDCFEAVLRHPASYGVFHSYSGSPELAAELVRRGWYISFSGVITFKNAPRVRSVAASVPLDRILLETDAPYLAPEPYRGKTNRSDYIAESAAVLASILGVTTDEAIGITADNARRLFLGE